MCSKQQGINNFYHGSQEGYVILFIMKHKSISTTVPRKGVSKSTSVYNVQADTAVERNLLRFHIGKAEKQAMRTMHGSTETHGGFFI